MEYAAAGWSTVSGVGVVGQRMKNNRQLTVAITGACSTIKTKRGGHGVLRNE